MKQICRKVLSHKKLIAQLPSQDPWSAAPPPTHTPCSYLCGRPLPWVLVTG